MLEQPQSKQVGVHCGAVRVEQTHNYANPKWVCPHRAHSNFAFLGTHESFL